MTDRIMTPGVAAADHSQNQYKLVKFDHSNSDKVALQTDPADTSSVTGSLEDPAPADGDPVSVIVAGLARVKFNDAVQPGEWFTNDTNALAVAYRGQGVPRGFALQQKQKDTAQNHAVRAVIVPAIPGLKLAKFSYDFANDGGVIGPIDLGTRLPNDAKIISAILDVTTTAISNGGNDAGTGALTVGGVTLEAAIAISDVSNPWDIQTRNLDTPGKTTSAGNVTLTIAVEAWEAGVFDGYILYTDA